MYGPNRTDGRGSATPNIRERDNLIPVEHPSYWSEARKSSDCNSQNARESLLDIDHTGSKRPWNDRSSSYSRVPLPVIASSMADVSRRRVGVSMGGADGGRQGIPLRLPESTHAVQPNFVSDVSPFGRRYERDPTVGGRISAVDLASYRVELGDERQLFWRDRLGKDVNLLDGPSMRSFSSERARDSDWLSVSSKNGRDSLLCDEILLRDARTSVASFAIRDRPGLGDTPAESGKNGRRIDSLDGWDSDLLKRASIASWRGPSLKDVDQDFGKGTLSIEVPKKPTISTGFAVDSVVEPATVKEELLHSSAGEESLPQSSPPPKRTRLGWGQGLAKYEKKKESVDERDQDDSSAAAPTVPAVTEVKMKLSASGNHSSQGSVVTAQTAMDFKTLQLPVVVVPCTMDESSSMDRPTQPMPCAAELDISLNHTDDTAAKQKVVEHTLNGLNCHAEVSKPLLSDLPTESPMDQDCQENYTESHITAPAADDLSPGLLADNILVKEAEGRLSDAAEKAIATDEPVLSISASENVSVVITCGAGSALNFSPVKERKIEIKEEEGVVTGTGVKSSPAGQKAASEDAESTVDVKSPEQLTMDHMWPKPEGSSQPPPVAPQTVPTVNVLSACEVSMEPVLPEPENKETHVGQEEGLVPQCPKIMAAVHVPVQELNEEELLPNDVCEKDRIIAEMDRVDVQIESLEREMEELLTVEEQIAVAMNHVLACLPAEQKSGDQQLLDRSPVKTEFDVLAAEYRLSVGSSKANEHEDGRDVSPLSIFVEGHGQASKRQKLILAHEPQEDLITAVGSNGHSAVASPKDASTCQRSIVLSILSQNREKAREAHHSSLSLLPENPGNCMGAMATGRSDNSPELRESMRRHLQEQAEVRLTVEHVLAVRYRSLRDIWHTSMRQIADRTAKDKAKHGTDRGRNSASASRPALRQHIIAANNALGENIVRRMVLQDSASCQVASDMLQMPAMYLGEREQRIRQFISTNGLVEDPAGLELERKAISVWTEEEKLTFYENFSLYPKDFAKIAQFLPHRTVADCVEFFYRNQKSAEFRAAQAQSKKKEITRGASYMATRQRVSHSRLHASIPALPRAKEATRTSRHSNQKMAEKLPNYGLFPQNAPAPPLLAMPSADLTNNRRHEMSVTRKPSGKNQSTVSHEVAEKMTGTLQPKLQQEDEHHRPCTIQEQVKPIHPPQMVPSNEEASRRVAVKALDEVQQCCMDSKGVNGRQEDEAVHAVLALQAAGIVGNGKEVAAIGLDSSLLLGAEKTFVVGGNESQDFELLSHGHSHVGVPSFSVEAAGAVSPASGLKNEILSIKNE